MRVALLAAASLIACSDGDPAGSPSPVGDAGVDVSDAGSDSAGEDSAGDADPAEATTDVSTDVNVEDVLDAAAPEPAVHYVGRHEIAGNRVRFGWPGTGLVVRFTGSGVRVRMNDPSGYFTVLVDGQEQARLETTPGEQVYELASGLAQGEHTVQLYRRAEGFFGVTEIAEVEVEGVLEAAPVAQRRIEVLGDSITCGYGNEGADQYCGFSAETENHYQTYGAIAARALNAELSAVAWSGKGVIFNYGDDTQEPLPELFPRAIPDEVGSTWGFAWQPDAVVINLGTNDFSTDGDPTESEFVGAYVALLESVRSAYPNALILCTVAPLLSGAELAEVMGYIDQAVVARAAAGDVNVRSIDLYVDAVGWGCDWHPSIATHELMGGKLADALRDELNW